MEGNIGNTGYKGVFLSHSPLFLQYRPNADVQLKLGTVSFGWGFLLSVESLHFSIISAEITFLSLTGQTRLSRYATSCRDPPRSTSFTAD